MKKYFLAGLLTCLAATVAQGQTKTDRDREGLQGAVRSVTLETSTFINQNGRWQESQRKKLTTVFYNEKGMIKETLQYRYDGELEAKQVVSYDEAGRRTETNFFNPDGSLNRKQLY